MNLSLFKRLSSLLFIGNIRSVGVLLRTFANSAKIWQKKQHMLKIIYMLRTGRQSTPPRWIESRSRPRRLFGRDGRRQHRASSRQEPAANRIRPGAYQAHYLLIIVGSRRHRPQFLTTPAYGSEEERKLRARRALVSK